MEIHQSQVKFYGLSLVQLNKLNIMKKLILLLLPISNLVMAQEGETILIYGDELTIIQQRI